MSSTTTPATENQSQGLDGEERSYIFLLYPPDLGHTLNPDLYIVRVPFRNLVVGLLAHQMLLQTVGSILLQGTSHVIPRYELKML